MNTFIKARLIQADLKEIDRKLEEKGFGDLFSMILLKQALIAIANLVDFEITIRKLYKENQDLSEIYRKNLKEFEFAKYLRNKFIGHIKSELIQKSIEWHPEMHLFIDRMSDSQVMYTYNILILDTAINTYVTADGKHKIFDSETDLFYPPDRKRFLIYITRTIKESIIFLEEILNTFDIETLCVKDSKEIIRLSIIAGKTNFEFIKK
ncbi:hypothetical protein ACQFN5_06610 [Klebsiella sp. WOUb02]|uniref:hypothetical protein n=1 Tax=Klebsiella sp. WOUb02 TaxID=3161071 RepID=UPI003CE89C6E